MIRKPLTEQQIKSKYNSISECIAICYIQTKRILEDAELLNMDTKPIKKDLACFIQEFMQLCNLPLLKIINLKKWEIANAFTEML